MKSWFVSAALIFATVAHAEGVRPIDVIMKTPVAELTQEERALRSQRVKERKLRIFGGNVIKPNSQTGSIAFLNAQTVLPGSEIDATVEMLYKTAKFKYDVFPFSPKADECPMKIASEALARTGAQIVIAIVADEKTPAMIVAPEDYWCVVNVSKLGTGIPSGPLYDRLFAARCRKELIRAFSLLCGGGSSQFGDNLMSVVGVEGLDSAKEFIPIDMEQRYTDYLEKLGVRPAYERSYKVACKEGWAPKPSNEYQQRIWDEFHQLPTKPIKIVPPNQK